MKRKFKTLTAQCLASLVLVSAISPVFAQNYNYTKPATKTTTSGYNYSPGYSTPNYQNGYNLPPLQGRVTTVPAGSVINGISPTAAISTQYLTAGDPVVFTLNQPYYFNGVAVLPAGTSIQGNAVIAQKAGFAGQYGKLKIMFNNANLPNGQRVPVSGKLLTNDRTGVLMGGTTGGRVMNAGKNAAIGAGAGALLGLIGSAVSGGKKGKGTAIMTGIGAGTGLLGSGIQKGNDVYLEAGQPVDIILDQPLTVGGNQSGYENNYNY
jgi:type IV secretion system protein VirB10